MQALSLVDRSAEAPSEVRHVMMSLVFANRMASDAIRNERVTLTTIGIETSMIGIEVDREGIEMTCI